MSKNDKQRELDELKLLHDTLEEGLPEVPPQLLEFARCKAKLEELRHNSISDPDKHEIPALKYQATTLNSLSSLMQYVNNTHQSLVESIEELQGLRQNIQKLTGEQSK
jgi:hypothetical protein